MSQLSIGFAPSSALCGVDTVEGIRSVVVRGIGADPDFRGIGVSSPFSSLSEESVSAFPEEGILRFWLQLTEMLDAS
jgi:hypothetical protein